MRHRARILPSESRRMKSFALNTAGGPRCSMTRAGRPMTNSSKAPAAGWQVTVEKRVATLTIDRPPLNILDIALCRNLTGAVNGLAGLDGVGVLVLAAAGKAFSAGVDVGEHRPDSAHESLQAFHALCRAIFDFPRPTLARVPGTAAGGA